MRLADPAGWPIRALAPARQATTRHALARRRGAGDRHYASLGLVVSADRIVFNIKGNSYRLVVAVDFEKASSGSMDRHPPRL
jgi:hypothetical protein